MVSEVILFKVMEEDFKTINVCSAVEYVAVSNFFCTIPGLEEALGIESLFCLGRIVRNISFSSVLVSS
jgi:hypothetical protein